MNARQLILCALTIGCVACAEQNITEPVNSQNETAPDETTSPIQETVAGCDGATFLKSPDDPAVMGPWAVGARTVAIGELIGEIWYPAQSQSEIGLEEIIYDIRAQLDPAEGAKISDEKNPWHPCECYRDLPLDTQRGPYPVIVFVHGTAGFRHQSLSFMTHWASRGFVVAALDHPGLKLGDLLAFRMTQDLGGDVAKLVDALDAQSGDLAFLAGAIDMTRLAASGHSAGGQTIRSWGGRAQVLIPMAAGGTDIGESLKSSLILGGMADGVAQYSGQQQGYEQTTGTKRLVGISNAGHLAFSDLCMVGRENGGLVQIAQEAGVTNANFASFLWDGCDPDQLPAETGIEIVKYASTPILQETLQCRGNQTATLPELPTLFPDVGEYLEAIE
ncbi:MAG: hypothetical protein HOI23_21940 [Deltaproteobacteria bacterium]|jgi:hypothetical protein|nr:hypothetical protein [Deltaproteobacteria bacterium]MBT6490902.1 hypothetical protein [Deltaproteobacteria bacterium]